MAEKTFEECVDDAVHAALAALGLTAEGCPDFADGLNDWLTDAARPYFAGDEEDEDDG